MVRWVSDVAEKRPTVPSTVAVDPRPAATPLPLGFLALFAASLLISAEQLRWVPVSQSHLLAIAVLVFSVPAQFLGCVMGFARNDPVAATGLGVLSGTWATSGVVLLTSPPGHVSAALGVLQLIAAVALLVPVSGAATTKAMASVVLFAAAVRFGIDGGYQLVGSPGWRYASGVAGIVVAALAAYGALAFELEGALGRAVLPVLRFRKRRQRET